MAPAVPPSPLDQYRQLEDRLAALIPAAGARFSAAFNLKLERITHLLALLGDPQRAWPIVHVGGTAGKGSTATQIAAILTAGGYRCGLHTSPHLQLFNERHQIDGRPAPTSQLLTLLDDMLPAIEQVAVDLPYGLPSYFEVQFALSCLWFARQAVDVAVVEVGLGGTLDATNVVPARVAVLTNVGLDHTEILGDTIELIISDKAGIIKPGQTVVTGVTQPTAHAIVAARSAQAGNRLWSLGREFAVTRAADGTLDLTLPGRRLTGVTLALHGAFQATNAAVATAAALAFDPTLSDDALRRGLRGAQIAGRMETVQTQPTVILDGAHNPDKMTAAAAAFAQPPAGRKTIVVFALKSGKALDDVLGALLPHCDVLVATQFSVKGLWEPLPTAQIAAEAALHAPNLPIYIEPDPLQAVALALTLAGADDVIWITGSLYLIGDVRNYWFPPADRIQALEDAWAADAAA